MAESPADSSSPSVKDMHGSPLERTTWIWEMRLAAAIPLPSWAAGVVLAAVLFAIYLLGTAVFDTPIWQVPTDSAHATMRQARFAFVLSIMVGFVMAGSRAVALSGFRIRQSLGFEDRDRDPAREMQDVLRIPRSLARRSRIGVAAGAAVGALVVAVVVMSDGPELGVSPWQLLADLFTSFGALFTTSISVLLFAIAGRGAYFTVSDALAIPGFVERDLGVDLLDLTSVQAYGRLSLSYALVWVAALSVATLLLGAAPPPVLARTTWTIAIPAVALVIPALAFVLPVRGVHRRVRSEKQAELARVDAALRGEPGAMDASRIAHRAADASLADLLMYRDHISAIREWPFDASTLRRFGLYLLIPVGSWLGGALVERLVDAFLD